MNLPTEQQCLGLFQKYHVPSTVQEHCLHVQKVANFLAQKFKQAGIDLNLNLVNSLALLHDLFKVVAIEDIKPNKFHQHNFSPAELKMRTQLRSTYPGLHESDVAYQIFKDDYPELAQALKDYSTVKENKSWEELLVHYADARVFKNQVVSLEKRFAYLEEHYPNNIGHFKKTGAEFVTFEKKLREINLDPNYLAEEIDGQ